MSRRQLTSNPRGEIVSDNEGRYHNSIASVSHYRSTLYTYSATVMSEGPQSLRATFAGAEKIRAQLEVSYDTNAASYQESLKQALSQYRQCLQLVESIALFSPNESLEDISTNDLQ